MKACPHCGAELRDSVIRCTRCLRPLDGEAESEQSVSTAAPSFASSATTVSSPPRAAPAPRASGWASPSARQPRPDAGSALDVAARRALPSDRRHSGHPDLVLLLAALAAAVAGYFAWKSIAQPWVQVVITDTSDSLNPVLVGEIELTGQSALVGTIGHAFAGAVGVFGLTWVFYGFDRGSTMPWFVSPAFAIIAAIGGLGESILSSTVWFVWKDAAAGHPRSVGLSAEKLRALLDLQPPPLVEIHRLVGLSQFGGMMLVGLVAASAAWWAYRRRG